MKLLTLHRNREHSQIELPLAATVYETALEELTSLHEYEAAALLASCTLALEQAGGLYAQREHLIPVKATLSGPFLIVKELELRPEMGGRVRQALDHAVGPEIHLVQVIHAARSDTSALAA